MDNGEWVYGGYYRGIMEETDNPFNIDNARIKTIIIQNGIYYHVIPETVGQFTEKKCRNKKEIYDGDIVETDSKKKLLVYWSNKEFAWKIKVFPQIWLGNKLTEKEDYFFHEYKDFAKYKDSSDVLDNLQIIGNTTDNPELLEVK